MTEQQAVVSKHAGIVKQLAMLRLHLDEGVALLKVAAEAGVSLRTARRWLARYRAKGPAGLARSQRSDAGTHKIAAELIEMAEGLALLTPPLSIATIHRRVNAVARERG